MLCQTLWMIQLPRDCKCNCMGSAISYIHYAANKWHHGYTNNNETVWQWNSGTLETLRWVVLKNVSNYCTGQHVITVTVIGRHWMWVLFLSCQRAASGHTDWLSGLTCLRKQLLMDSGEWEHDSSSFRKYWLWKSHSFSTFPKIMLRFPRRSWGKSRRSISGK